MGNKASSDGLDDLSGRVRTADELSDIIGDSPEDIYNYTIIRLNVGGVTFNTFRQTLQRYPHCRLANERFLQHHYSDELKAFFFDRDPDMFKAILNYLRTGYLHIPSYICGPAAREELAYWGLAPNKIEKCCWINYNEWNSTQEALKQLEKDRKLNSASYDQHPSRDATWWQIWRPRVWRMLNRSNSSVAAKVFSIVSLFFVLLSILSFLAETTDPFRNEKSAKMQTTTTGTTPSNPNISTSTSVGTTSEATEEHRSLTKHPLLLVIDCCCLFYFLLEYIIRFIFAPKKLKNATSLLSVIDLLAILPDVIELCVYIFNPELNDDVTAVNYITILRVIRVLRIFRLVRHSAGLWILIYTLRASFSELMLLVWFMMLGILLFSSLIYYSESQEEFNSIPSWFWWALITMTTVGYGDMYPVTILGKLVGSLCAMCGVLMIGFTVPALVNNFMLYYRHLQFAMQVEIIERELNEETRANVAEKDTHGFYEDNVKMSVSAHCNDKNGNTSTNSNEVKTPLVNHS